MDDRFNEGGYNRYTFERSMQPTIPVQAMPTCATFNIPLCTTPLAVVHEPADSTAANAVSSVISTLLRQNPQIAAADVAYYNTSAGINSAMLAAPLSVLAALHFPSDFHYHPVLTLGMPPW